VSRRIAVAALAAALLGTAPASASSWSSPERYDRPSASCRHQACVIEPAPRVAVNAGGAAVAAWVDPRRRVRVAFASRPGHFGAATTVGAQGLRPSAAIAPDGTATVVWLGPHGTLRFARRPPAQRRFGASVALAAPGGDEGDDFAKAAAEPDGSVVVAYESGDLVRAVTISPAGAPGPPTTLGDGGFGHDSTRAAPDGTLAACCIQPVVSDPNVPPDTAARVAVYRPATGWRLISAAAIGNDGIETVFGTATDLALGTIRIAQGGDAGVLGVPGVARAGAGAGDVLGAPLRAPVTRSDRGLAPSVAIDGSGRSVLLFQEKAKPQAFSRAAPVYASVAAAGATALPGRQRLDGRLGYEPAVRPLGPGAIGVWQDPGARWGVAIEGDGIFHRAAPPAGRGPSTLGEDFSYAYDLQAAGTHAVLAWVASDGSIRVSELS
jgi:hypothetical protein